jgi:hypothetical protein
VNGLPELGQALVDLVGEGIENLDLKAETGGFSPYTKNKLY